MKETKSGFRRLVIEIEGKEYPAEISMGAMKRFKDETGKEVSQISGESEWGIFLWCCVKSASSRAGVTFEMDCMEFLDYCTPETMLAWRQAQQLMEEGSKKKNLRGNLKESTNS